MRKEKSEQKEVAHTGSMEILPTNVCVMNAAMQEMYTPKLSFNSHWGKYRLAHSTSLGGAVVLFESLD